LHLITIAAIVQPVRVHGGSEPVAQRRSDQPSGKHKSTTVVKIHKAWLFPKLTEMRDMMLVAVVLDWQTGTVIQKMLTEHKVPCFMAGDRGIGIFVPRRYKTRATNLITKYSRQAGYEWLPPQVPK
jgi:hypothetical protein